MIYLINFLFISLPQRIQDGLTTNFTEKRQESSMLEAWNTHLYLKGLSNEKWNIVLNILQSCDEDIVHVLSEIINHMDALLKDFICSTTSSSLTYLEFIYKIKSCLKLRDRVNAIRFLLPTRNSSRYHMYPSTNLPASIYSLDKARAAYANIKRFYLYNLHFLLF